MFVVFFDRVSRRLLVEGLGPFIGLEFFGSDDGGQRWHVKSE